MEGNRPSSQVCLAQCRSRHNYPLSLDASGTLPRTHAAEKEQQLLPLPECPLGVRWAPSVVMENPSGQAPEGHLPGQEAEGRAVGRLAEGVLGSPGPLIPASNLERVVLTEHGGERRSL